VPAKVDALIFAGGRISGLFARAAGTRIKALVPVRGRPCVSWVAAALRDVAAIDRICVAGPQAVGDLLTDDCTWVPEGANAIENLRRGIQQLTGLEWANGGVGEWGNGGSARATPPCAARILLCGADAPAVTAAAIADFLGRVPEEADICQPVVRREVFREAFPGNAGIYVRLVEGAFTGGCQFLVRPEPLLRSLPLVEALFRRRKSQLAMTHALGLPFLCRLIAGRLTVQELEGRLSELTGCGVRAVLDCAPELAFDVDNLLDLRYLERHLSR